MFHIDVQRRFTGLPRLESIATPWAMHHIAVHLDWWIHLGEKAPTCCRLLHVVHCRSITVPMIHILSSAFPSTTTSMRFPAFSSYFTQCIIAARACVIPVQSSHRNLTAIRWSCQGTHGIAKPRRTGEPWTAKWTEAAGWKEVDTTSEQNRLWNFQVTHDKTTN